MRFLVRGCGPTRRLPRGPGALVSPLLALWKVRKHHAHQVAVFAILGERRDVNVNLRDYCHFLLVLLQLIGESLFCVIIRGNLLQNIIHEDVVGHVL